MDEAVPGTARPRLPKGADPQALAEAVALLADKAPLPSLVRLADRSRAAFKAVCAALDHGGERRDSLAAEAGVEPGSARRLLRAALDRSDDAQVRRNPVARNEGFRCAACGHEVPPAPGSGVRNHCPRCLCSLHVDGPVPGDRAADCGGVMRPVRAERAGGAWWLSQRCEACGHERRNRLHPEWTVDPDDLAATNSIGD